MEHLSHSQEQEQRKIYTDGKMWLVGFLGGPLGAGYIMAQNFRAFNEPEKVRITWYITVLATLLVWGGLAILPGYYIDKIPHHLIPAIYMAIAAALMYAFQQEKIKTYLADGGKKYGWWRSVGIGFISLILSVLLAFAVDASVQTTKVYGSARHEITFNRLNVSAHTIDNVAHALTKAGWFYDNAEFPEWVTVERVRNRLHITLLVYDGYMRRYRAEMIEDFTAKGTIIQSLLPHHPIVLQLLPDTFADAFLSNYVRLDGFEVLPLHELFRPCPTTFDAGVVLGETRWATRNVGASGIFVENIEDGGNHFTWHEAQRACPPGWRLPYSREMVALRTFFETWTIRNETGGGWFTQEPFLGIFLPAAGYRPYYDDEPRAGLGGYYWINNHFPDEGVASGMLITEYPNEARFFTAPFTLRISVRCVARD